MIVINGSAIVEEETAYYYYSVLVLYTMAVHTIMSNCVTHMSHSHLEDIMIFQKVFLIDPSSFSSKLVVVEREHLDVENYVKFAIIEANYYATIVAIFAVGVWALCQLEPFVKPGMPPIAMEVHVAAFLMPFALLIMVLHSHR